MVVEGLWSLGNGVHGNKIWSAVQEEGYQRATAVLECFNGRMRCHEKEHIS